MTTNVTETTTRLTAKTVWWLSFWWLPLVLVLISPALQLPWVVCACAKSEAKGLALLVADAAIGIRALVALARRDNGLSWIAYILLYVVLVPLTLKLAGEL